MSSWPVHSANEHAKRVLSNSVGQRFLPASKLPVASSTTVSEKSCALPRTPTTMRGQNALSHEEAQAAPSTSPGP